MTGAIRLLSELRHGKDESSDAAGSLASVPLIGRFCTLYDAACDEGTNCFLSHRAGWLSPLSIS